QDALRDAYKREAGYKGALYEMQSTVVLQGMFSDRMSSQLAVQKEKRKGKKQEQLVGDGLRRLLTGDEFYNSVVEHHEAADAEAVA
ncbi:hypothetical protein DFJ58DRAFT_662402, partial [Suillus subalutaceus]|uniref:uncharacterized protein n=1 Tax=Suillus subalutaceus TaxID=48586 RepID=UPI001B86AD5E